MSLPKFRSRPLLEIDDCVERSKQNAKFQYQLYRKQFDSEVIEREQFILESMENRAIENEKNGY